KYERRFFAEGITIFGDKIYQLTWRNKRVFQYEKKDFHLVTSWPFPREGWGITHDTEQLIVSDGTAHLYFLDPETLAEKRRISVHDNKGEVARLNELEYIQGTIYANIWQTDRIVIIQPKNGSVTGWLDLAALSDQMRNNKKTGVLNGIMYDPEQDRLFVTGKLWPSLFEIRTVRNNISTVKPPLEPY
ncbi:MAG: glutaminyl-peptide cyclotransferase, partial [Candidatus Electrothrix sp. AR4]|nr:glutaminyl-peptide cyclotransferase [Candidatus Electrothrix sp. AR4]